MSKYPVELKIAACKEFLDGKLSLAEVCEKYGIYYDIINTKLSYKKRIILWIKVYLLVSWKKC